MVVLNDAIDTELRCKGSNCKDFLRVYAGGSGIFRMECNEQDGCIRSQIRIGDLDEIPIGYNVKQFESKRNKNAYVKINCGGKGACIGSTFYIKGDYPKGVTIVAMGQDAFDGSVVVCELKKGICIYVYIEYVLYMCN